MIWKKVEERVPLQNQVKVVRLQDKLDEQNFHENMKSVFEPVTDRIKNTSQKLTKTITENSFKINEAIESLNNKLLVIMNGRCIISSYLFNHLLCLKSLTLKILII